MKSFSSRTVLLPKHPRNDDDCWRRRASRRLNETTQKLPWNSNESNLVAVPFAHWWGSLRTWNWNPLCAHVAPLLFFTLSLQKFLAKLKLDFAVVQTSYHPSLSYLSRLMINNHSKLPCISPPFTFNHSIWNDINIIERASRADTSDVSTRTHKLNLQLYLSVLYVWTWLNGS